MHLPAGLKPHHEHHAMMRQRGMTLVELVIAIVIIGIAAAALYSAMASFAGRSADPMLRQQSVLLAEAYLEEILAQAYADPGAAACNQRLCFDDVLDYHNLDDQPPQDARGGVLNQLAGYRVRVSVSTGSLGAGAASVAARYVEVRVSDPTGAELRLGGYRGDY
jgi:MSHA pilin protein MshD